MGSRLLRRVVHRSSPHASSHRASSIEGRRTLEIHHRALKSQRHGSLRCLPNLCWEQVLLLQREVLSLRQMQLFTDAKQCILQRAVFRCRRSADSRPIFHSLYALHPVVLISPEGDALPVSERQFWPVGPTDQFRLVRHSPVYALLHRMAVLFCTHVHDSGR